MENTGKTGILTLYSDVQATPVRWLWFPFIATGKITLLEGNFDEGKTAIVLDLIAELSKGGNMPDGKPVGMPQRVVYQSTNAGLPIATKVALEKYGANCKNVASINEEPPKYLKLDDERLRQAMEEFRPQLVVIDPVQVYIENSRISKGARSAIHQLGIWATMYDCAIVLISRQDKTGKAKKKVNSDFGITDIVSAARSVLQVDCDPENSNIGIIWQTKNNLEPSGRQARFAMARDSRLNWLRSEVPPKPEMPEFESNSEKAAYWIKKLLSEDDMRVREIYMRLSYEGISRRTAENLKQELGIREYRKKSQLYWSLKSEDNSVN